jgi:hypothetical protein
MATPPSLTNRSGLVATKGTNAEQIASQRLDVSTKVWGYDPAGSPALKILSDRASSSKAISYEYYWLEDVPVPSTFSSTAGANSSATSVTVDADAAAIQVGDLLKIGSTGEIVTVSAINTSTRVATISRGSLGTTAATIPANAKILNLRTPQPEGAKAPQALATVKQKCNNYTQIVRTPYHLSRTLVETQHFTGDELAYTQRKAGEAHARAWEEIFLHGIASEDVTGAKPVRTTGGLDHFIKTNALAPSGGTLVENDFIDWLRDVFRFSANPGNKQKVLLASGEIVASISSWGLEKLRHNDKASDFHGFDVTSYITSFGKLNIVYHPLLEGAYAGTGYVLDMDAISKKVLHSTELRTDIQDPDEDSRRGEFLTEQGFMVAMERAHGKITGVTF